MPPSDPNRIISRLTCHATAPFCFRANDRSTTPTPARSSAPRPQYTSDVSPRHAEPILFQPRHGLQDQTASGFASNISPRSVGPPTTSQVPKDYFSYHHVNHDPRAGSILLVESHPHPKLVQSHSGPTISTSHMARSESSPGGDVPQFPQVTYMPFASYNAAPWYRRLTIHTHKWAQAGAALCIWYADYGSELCSPYGVQYYTPMMMGPGPDSSVPRAMEECNNALLKKRRIIKRRTRTGCLTCRKRRIKCDERKPHCFNCERSKSFVSDTRHQMQAHAAAWTNLARKNRASHPSTDLA